jgi:structural maintenance of chromosome 2
VKSAENDKKRLESEENELLTIQQTKTKEAEHCDEQIQEIIASYQKMDKVMATLKDTETKISREVVVANTTLNNHKESIQKEEELVQSLTKQLEHLELTKQQKEQDLVKCQNDLKNKEEVSTKNENAYKELRERLQNAAMGVANEQTAEFLSIPEQILTWEKVARESESKLKTNEQQMKHKQAELTSLKKNLTKQSSSVASLAKEIENLKVSIVKKEEQCQGVTNAMEEDQRLRTQISHLTAEMNALRDNLESKQARLNATLRFDFQDPDRNFDRRRVRGKVAELFRLKGKDTSMSVALEVVAGSRLHNVVVDNEEIAAQLIKKGQLRTRNTFLPLNKISHSVLSADKVNRAKQIAARLRGSADLAIDLITFDENVRNAMEHVFGNVIICSSSDIAKNVAFDDQIRVKTVSYAGDTFDPAGTLTAGTSSSGNTLLADVFFVQSHQELINAKNQEWQQMKANLQQNERVLNASRELTNSLDVLKHQLQMKESQMAESDYSQMNAQIQELEGELRKIELVSGLFTIQWCRSLISNFCCVFFLSLTPRNLFN